MLDIPPEPAIVITASRAPQAAKDNPASVTIVDAKRIDRLGEPLVPALLRLVPSTSVATSGPAGSLTEVRIRGAEAYHTLLFVDGIRANDPASGNAPRFELLNADLASRIEVVRGPQSALWGSEALGGVIAVAGLAGGTRDLSASAETGSFGFARATVGGSAGPIAAAVGWQRSDGIDSFGGGDRDGYRNLSGRLRGSVHAAGVEVRATAFAIAGRSEFDGFDPFTFARTEDLDSRNRLAAGSLSVHLGEDESAWRGQLTASSLRSTNRNGFAGTEINRTKGGRTTLSAQAERRFATAGVSHLAIVAIDHEQESFGASDRAFGGFTAQSRSRERQSLTLEWRGDAGPISGNVALRHDRFAAFRDSTSLRAGLVAEVGGGVSIAGSYGEGIAQPTFFDQFGFFPGSFVGNPGLAPESSRGVEASVRVRRRAWDASLTAFRQRLGNEIVDVFDTFPFTVRNLPDKSRRTGVEGELGWVPSKSVRLSANAAWLNASQPEGAGLVREIRRPRVSGSLVADGSLGRVGYGLSLAYTGARFDRREEFPFDRVRLGSYWLAGARVGYTLTQQLEMFARGANLLDQQYQDVFGYRTEGRSLHAGIRLAAGR